MAGRLTYKKTLVVMVVLAAAAGAGWYFWSTKRSEAPAYREVSVTRGNIEATIVSTAVIQPRNRLEIKPPIAGRVEEVLVNEGQMVAKGHILAWMSSTERAALLDAARTKGPEELRRWEEMYRPTAIIAPIRGMVIARNTEPGQTFTANDAVFVMSDQLTVKAQVDETDIALVKLRQPADVTLDAYPEHAFKGQVEAIAYDAKTVSNVTTYEVDVQPHNPPAFLRAGMTANVRFHIASKQDALLLPSAAIKVRDGRTYALVPAGDGTQVEREVRVGLSDGRNSEVAEGLAEGDKVLIAQLRKNGAGNDKRTSSPLTPTPRKRN
jgi:macrolide-specific efflux system membrane fusion protein